MDKNSLIDAITDAFESVYDLEEQWAEEQEEGGYTAEEADSNPTYQKLQSARHRLASLRYASARDRD